jgi:hypothetical protein
LKELSWQKEAFPPSPMHNSNCLYFDVDLFVSFRTTYIQGFRPNGSQMFNASVEYEFSPSRLAKFNDFLLVDLQSKTGGYTYLATFYLATGAEKQRMLTDYKVVEFFTLDENLALIAGNNSSGGILIEYDPYQNIETSILPVPGEIVCMEQLTISSYILSTENSMLVYDHDQSSLTSILPGRVAYRIRFDETEDEIYTASPNLIEKIKYPQMILEKSYPIADSILNIHLLYNK